MTPTVQLIIGLLVAFYIALPALSPYDKISAKEMNLRGLAVLAIVFLAAW